MLSVSTYASQLTTLTNIQRNQNDFDRLARQVATGVKSEDLSDFSAVDAQRLLNGEKEVQRLEAYNKGIDIVTPRLKLYSQATDRMDTLAKTVLSAMTKIDSFDGAKQVELGTLVDNTLRDLNALLNDQVDGRYLWAGTNYTEAPVGDLTALPDLATPAAFTPVANPALPDYYAAAPGADANAWVETAFSPEAGKTVQYGQVAANPAIQELVNALRLVKSGLNAAAAAPDSATANTLFNSFRTEAQSQLTDARSGLTQLSSAISMDLASITDSAKANKAAINLFVDEQGKIVNIDTAEAGVKLNQVKNQLAATYQITASLTQTSLVNYL